MAVLCSPFGPRPQFELSSGVPAVGNKLFFYVAGSVNTKQNTYTSSTGGVANTNPVVLDALGMPTNCELWFTAGQTYKVVYAPSTDTDPPTSPIWTIDNLSGINDVSASLDQWVPGPAPTFVSATSFTLVGDQTTNFQPSRRVKTTNSGGTIFSTIITSAFGVVTTVVVANDSGVLDSGLSAVSYSLISATNQSINADMVNRKGTAVASAATTNIWGIAGDYVHVTGAVTITSLGTAPYAGAQRTVIFDGALTLTHNATTLLLPGGINITTAANDRIVVRADTTTNMIVVAYIAAAGTGDYRSVQVFAANGTYTAPAGLKRAKITLVGGGGAGGGGAATGVNQVSVGAGGTYGSIVVKTLSATTIGASQTVTIGPGGTGNSGATGNAGTQSTFGALLTANGGPPGTTSAAAAAGGVPGVIGVTPTGGDLNIPGPSGSPGIGSNAGGNTFNVGGNGASGPYGSGGIGAVQGNAAGGAGSGNGAGGGGAIVAPSASAQTGGAGVAGICIVEEFF